MNVTSKPLARGVSVTFFTSRYRNAAVIPASDCDQWQTARALGRSSEDMVVNAALDFAKAFGHAMKMNPFLKPDSEIGCQGMRKSICETLTYSGRNG